MLNARYFAIAIATAFLTGCLSGGIKSGGGDHERWQLSGKIGIRSPQLAESAYIRWQQCGDRFAIRISGPLGQTVARIDGLSELLTVQFEGRDAITTREPELLMQQQLGWSLPIHALRYWVRAEAAPGERAEFSGATGQPDTLHQQHWQVNYLAYHRLAEHQAANQKNSDIALPAKLRLTRDADVNDAQNLQATLLINEWLLGDAAACP